MTTWPFLLGSACLAYIFNPRAKHFGPPFCMPSIAIWVYGFDACGLCLRIHKIMPIMLALCLMLLHTYYAKNYAGIIDSGHYLI